MAEIPVSDEEMALRRRARRRLVGAVALALTAIVLLPMLFDPEPKPLGPDIDVQIPPQDTPFKPVTPAPAPASPAPVEPAPSMLNPVETTPPSQMAPLPVAKPAESTQPAVSKPVESSKPASKAADPSATKKPETASRPAGKGYSLQLGLFDKKANADKLIERARSAGFKAQASEIHGRWRVQVGPLTERAKAEDLQAKLKAKGLDAVLVGP